MNENLNKLQSDLKKVLPIILTAGTLIVLIYFWKSFYVQVESYEKGVVLKLGHLSTKILQPGPNWRLPYPLHDVHKIDVVNDRKLQIGFSESRKGGRVHREREALTLTKFGNLVDIEMEVNYFISDPAKYVLMVKTPDLSVKQTAESVMRLIVGQYSIDDILTEKKSDIVQEIYNKMQEILDSYNIGIGIRRVQFIKVVNPSNVIEAFEDVENAKQDSAKAYLDAERYSNQKLPEARGNAKKQIEEAKGYAQSLVARAQGDSARFTQLLVKYQKHKSVTRKRLYLETVDQVLPGIKKIIVDEKVKTTNLLPLGKL
jgi:membrane protease subunit HflK